MKIRTLALNAFSLAIAGALCTPTHAAHNPLAGHALALVPFGMTGFVPDTDARLSALDLSVLQPSDIAGVDHAGARQVIATVEASAFPLAEGEAVTLTHLFERGSPVLLHMDTDDISTTRQVRAFFGVAPAHGEVIVQKGSRGVEVFAPVRHSDVDTSDLLKAWADKAEKSPVLARFNVAAEGNAATRPTRHFDVNMVDAEGEITGVTGIDVTRSRTRATDFKIISVTSKTAVTVKKAGVVDGDHDNGGLWSTHLPFAYHLAHAVTAKDTKVTYLDHFPTSDGRTEFTQTDTKTRGFSIGGSTGAELSADGTPDQILASKLPFNLTAGFEYGWSSELSNTFRDYSLIATPDPMKAVSWTAKLDPKLEGVLVKRWGAEMPQLTEDRMTPMMRSAPLQALSEWKVPGEYEGVVTVAVTAGYELDTWEWWWEHAGIRYEHALVPRDETTTLDIDMRDPYLTAETTVLLRSALGGGQCLRDNEGQVGLAECLSTDRMQMWGLDPSSRYVNRGSGNCLAAQPDTGAVITDACASDMNNKQWQWLADRLHAKGDAGRFRLIVANGQPLVAKKGEFADFPINPNASVLDPWTGYPLKPRVGDYIPAPAQGGIELEPIPDVWADYPAVSDDQRWSIDVLRQGL